MSFRKMWTSLIGGGVMAAAIMVGGAAAPALASPGVEDLQVATHDSNQVLITSDKYTFHLVDGIMKYEDESTGEVGELPATTTNTDGYTFDLKYGLSEEGDLLVEAIDPNANEKEARSDFNDDAKCWLAIVGTGVGGAIGGTAVGGPAGAIAGGLAGAAVGTANHCL